MSGFDASGGMGKRKGVTVMLARVSAVYLHVLFSNI
jgi:hypothetical protein